MENSKEAPAADTKPTNENPNPSPNSDPSFSPPQPAAAPAPPESSPAPPSRTPFTSLSQVDADLALARTLQEQERAYMMLRMNGGDDYASSDSGSYVYEDELLEGADGDDGDDDEEDEDPDRPVEGGESGDEEGSDYGEDAFDANVDEHDVDPAEFDSDEAYARALQEAEEQEVAARLMSLTGLSDWGVEDLGNRGSISQDAWQDVDPDELSYEELVALGEVVGTHSRGLSADTIATLPSVSYKAESTQDGGTDPCVICRLDYEDGESVVVLSCKHTYHSECINKWLQINKVCPVCSAEVSTSESRQ